MTAIQELTPSSIDRAAETVGLAFAADPMFEWVFPEAASRPAALQRFNRVAVE